MNTERSTFSRVVGGPGLSIGAAIPRLVGRWLLAVLMAVAIAGCSPDPEGEKPATLRIGVLPDQDKEATKARFAPLLDHLSRELGVPAELKVPKSYADLLRMFRAKEIDLGYFGGVTFVQANASDDAVPVVMRDVDAKFTSYYLVLASNRARNVSDFAGRDFAFGSRLSTSGHLMPRHFLEQDGMKPETFFGRVRYSGAHDKTAYMVRDGMVDIGVANAQVVDAMFRDGRLDSGQVRVLSETPPYPDYVWAARAGLNESFLIALRDAFLGLSWEDESHRRVLDSVGARSFFPASPKDFAGLRTIMENTPQLAESR